MMDRFKAVEFVDSKLTIAGDSVALTFAENGTGRSVMIEMSLQKFGALAFAVQHRAEQIRQKTGAAMPHSDPSSGRR